jgi:hypothetical protein
MSKKVTPMNKPVTINEMQMETNLSVKFIYAATPTKEEQASLDALNIHADDIAESLQTVFRALVIEMLSLKRKTHTGGENEKP